MAMYVILSKLSPDAFEDPKEFRKLADNVASRIRKQCPNVTWRQSFATLGRFDVGWKRKFVGWPRADSGDVARSFRDYVARCSDIMSPG